VIHIKYKALMFVWSLQIFWCLVAGIENQLLAPYFLTVFIFLPEKIQKKILGY